MQLIFKVLTIMLVSLFSVSFGLAVVGEVLSENKIFDESNLTRDQEDTKDRLEIVASDYFDETNGDVTQRTINLTGYPPLNYYVSNKNKTLEEIDRELTDLYLSELIRQILEPSAINVTNVTRVREGGVSRS